MKNNVTTVEDPDAPDETPKSFTYDYSYWSFDGFKERPDGYFASANSSSGAYCDQVSISI